MNEGETEAQTDEATNQGEGHGRFFTIEVDGKEVRFDHTPVTVLEVMAAAGVPATEGLLELMADGTQRKVDNTEIFDLEAGRRVKRRPRFRRGNA